MKPLWKFWERFGSKLSCKKILLFLDFDGTLVPIARDPESAKLSAASRQVLSRLSVSDRVRLCVISGRRVRTLKALLGIRNVSYVGNHGFEIEVPGLGLTAPAVSSAWIRKYLAPVAKRLKSQCRRFSGARLENKRHTLSLHFRKVAAKDLGAFRKIYENIKKEFSALPLVWREGKKVFEILPNVRWNKGSAALLVCDGFPDSFPVILGDDATDEDMFKALRMRGLTIRIGRSKKSYAKFYLPSQKEVLRFLICLRNLAALSF